VPEVIELDALSLQIRYTWKGRLVGVRELAPATREVRLATEQGWYWTLLGIGMGWVKPAMAPLLRTSPPGLSDVQPRLRGDFIVPDGALSGDGSEIVWHRYPGGCMVDAELDWQPRVLRRGRPVDVSTLRREGRWRESGGHVLIELGPDLELVFDVAGCAFSTTLVGTAPRVGPQELDAVDRTWVLWLTAFAAIATLALILAGVTMPVVNSVP
jgi:hypothetical protein